MKTPILSVAGVLAVATALAGAAPVRAAVTHSSVTSAGTAFGFDNRTLAKTDPANTRAVVGTSDGTSADHVDIRCKSPDIDYLLKAGVPVLTGGSFSATVILNDFSQELCHIVAVPAGTDPPEAPPLFTGPAFGNGEQRTFAGGSGAHDFYISQSQRGAFDTYGSLGDGGLTMALYGTDLRKHSSLFGDNAALYAGSYSVGMKTGSYAQVDGAEAFDPHQANAKNSSASTPPVLTYAHTVDTSTGNGTITEIDPLSRCSGACPTFTPTGLRVERKIFQDRGGRVVRISDVIRSTDGHPHAFAFDYDEYNYSPIGGSSGFRFPRQFAYAAHAPGDAVPAGADVISSVGSIYDISAVPSLDNPVGVMTVSPAPVRSFFRLPNGFNQLFTGTVPGGGTKTIRHSYAMGATQTEVTGYASENEDQLGAPSVAITKPAPGGSRVPTSKVSVAGTASDNKGIASLVVNGRPASVKDGRWSIVITLARGANSVTALVRDSAGNQTTAKRTVTWVPTKVTLGKVRVKHTSALVGLRCQAASGPLCTGTVGFSTRLLIHRRVRSFAVGRARYKLVNGSRTVTVHLTRIGRSLLAKRRYLAVRVTVRQGHTKVVGRRVVTFRW